MKSFLVFLLTMFITTGTFAQKFSVDLYGGVSRYLGDLQDQSLSFSQAHLAGGIGVSYTLSDHFSLRTGVLFGKLSGDDKLGRNKQRNLNFTSSLTDIHLGLQYYILPLGQRSLAPYVFAGVGLYHFNPYTHDTSGTKYYLRPLSTEGQGFIEGKDYYELTQFNVPFGAGVKLSLSENLNVGLEVGLRKLFTDYVDDVSGVYVDQAQLLANRGQAASDLAFRGDELKDGAPYPAAGTLRGGKSKDWYYFTGLTLSFRLGNGTIGHSRRGNTQYGCPVNVY